MTLEDMDKMQIRGLWRATREWDDPITGIYNAMARKYSKDWIKAYLLGEYFDAIKIFTPDREWELLDRIRQE